MPLADWHGLLQTLETPLGPEDRYLRIGDRYIHVRGLSRELADELQVRWGGFLQTTATVPAALELDLVVGPATADWLVRAPSGERYRMEAAGSIGQRVVVSYNFALGEVPSNSRRWKVALRPQPDEPEQRLMDNVGRYFAARLGLAQGGVALHAGGVLEQGRAFLFAGPSRSGKSTAVRLSAPRPGLGDDLALVLPAGDGWVVPALPFDNSERIERALEGLFPLAGIWRLAHGPAHVVRPAAGSLAVAQLVGCAAFPWAIPDAATQTLEQVERLVAAGLFAHLEFTPDPGFWSVLL